MDERAPLVRPGPYGSMPPPMGSPQYAPFHPSPGYAPFPVATPAVYGGGFDGMQMIATPHAVPPPAGPPAPVPAAPVVLNEARFPDHISAVAPFAMSAKPASMCHWRPMITTVLFAGSLAWLVATVAGVDDATTQAVVLPAVAVCCTIFGFVYACEAGFADTRRYLSNILESGDATSFLDRLRNTPPRVTMNVVCFHMETRYSTVTESDGRGGSRTRTVPNTVRVDTFRESQEVPFTAWRDVSGPTAGLERFRLTKLRLEKFATWADEVSRTRFYQEFAQFQFRNRWRDQQMEASWTIDVDGFQDRILALTGAERPRLLGLGWYAVASLFLCSLPYRMWLSSISVETEYSIRKELRMV